MSACVGQDLLGCQAEGLGDAEAPFYDGAKDVEEKDARWLVHGRPWIAGTCNSTAVPVMFWDFGDLAGPLCRICLIQC